MGQPAWGDAQASRAEYIGTRGAGGELKHLSSRTTRNQHEIPQVVASERGAAQTNASLEVLGL